MARNVGLPYNPRTPEACDKPVATTGYKDKLTVCRRRYHSVLWTHCEGIFLAYVPLRLQPSENVSAFLIPCQWLRGFEQELIP